MRERDRLVTSEEGIWELEFRGASGGTYDNAPSLNPITHMDGVFDSEYLHEWMQDVETDRFNRKKNQGKIINSPMTQQVIAETVSPAMYHQYYRHQYYGGAPKKWYDLSIQDIDGTLNLKDHLSARNVGHYLEIGLSDYELGNLKALAITEAWGNISHAEVLALVSAAEMEKTVDGLVSLLKKVLKITTQVNRKNLKGLRNSMGDLKRDVSFSDLSEIYMQARYGLRPLYYEIRGLLKALETDLTLPGGNRFTFRGHSETNCLDSSQSEILDKQHPYMTSYLNVNKTAKLDATVRAGVLTQLDCLTANKLGGIDKIPETVFELVPYSFIAGWFFNVASLVASWSPNMGSETLASWVTVKTIVSQTTTVGGSRHVDLGNSTSRYKDYTRGVVGSMTKTTTDFSRVPEPSRPVLPRFELNLDPLKLLDLGIIGHGIWKNARLAKRLRL